MNWLVFALMTVAFWGVYGVFLHKGQILMKDPDLGRYKAFFWVGIAYFLVAIVGPAAILLAKGASWKMPDGGVVWSLIAGIVGALGAFCVLLAFGAKGNPAVVMAIIFAGAPIVNAIVVLTTEGIWGKAPPMFYVGILLAAGGGFLVTKFKPHGGPPKKPVPAVEAVQTMDMSKYRMS